MLKFFCLALSLIFVSLAVAAPQEPLDAIFDFTALAATPLDARVLKSVENDGIVTEDVMFHSERDGDKDVEIFGIFSYPKGAQKLPAFVWNQAGMAQATPYFTELGARRGYAALCIDLPLPGYRSTGAYPISADFNEKLAPRAQPIYHGAVALLKAVSFLQSRPEVDASRIGMAGSSWGGFWTTLMAGIDPRIKAGSAMFGTGNLQLGSSWWDGEGNAAKRDTALREAWRTSFDPAFRLARSKAALAWFSGANDHFYWMPALMKTYEMQGGAKHLTLLPNWNHGLTPILDDEVFVWLDVHLQGKPPLLAVSPLEVQRKGSEMWAQWRVSGTRKIASANLILSPGEAGNWESRPWKTLPAQIENGVCRVALPSFVKPYFVSGSVVDGDGYVSSTPLVRVTTISKPTLTIDYDGAASWGEFEKDGITFVNAQGFGHLISSRDARSGEQSLSLQAGANILRPLYYVPGALHRLTVFLKADQPTNVTIELNGRFDGNAQATKQEFAIGTQWTPATLDFVPPPSLAGTLAASVTIPEVAHVVADSLSFTLQRAEPTFKSTR